MLQPLVGTGSLLGLADNSLFLLFYPPLRLWVIEENSFYF